MRWIGRCRPTGCSPQPGVHYKPRLCSDRFSMPRRCRFEELPSKEIEMRRSIITLALLLGTATAAGAQGRGGRGAGPDWSKPQGTMCIDTDNITKVEVLKGAAAVAAYGADATNGIVIIYTKPGPGLRNCAAPSNGGDDALGKVLLSPDLVMSHQQ